VPLDPELLPPSPFVVDADVVDPVWSDEHPTRTNPTLLAIRAKAAKRIFGDGADR